MTPLYTVEILDSTLNAITQIKGFYPWADQHFLEYGDTLSTIASAKFRVSTQDPLFDTVGGTGDIFVPWVNHVRIKRGGIVVWQGIITKNPHRTHRYVEVYASTYLAWLNKVLVKNSASVTAGDGLDNYRTFDSGTMGQAVMTILQETKAKFPAGHLINSMIIGQIDNPDFPSNYTKADGTTPLTGPWTFGPDLKLQYDYKTALYILTSLGVYGACDFRVYPSLDSSGNFALTFEFKKFLGTSQPRLMFEYGQYGTIADYDLPANGDRMVNSITGIAADPDGKVLHNTQSDSTSVAKYGALEGVAAFADVKNTNALITRLAETLRLVSTPNAEVNVTLNNKAYPLGVYGVGDIVTIKIKDHFINFQDLRRIVSLMVVVYVNGEENVNLSTNVPRKN